MKAIFTASTALLASSCALALIVSPALAKKKDEPAPSAATQVCGTKLGKEYRVALSAAQTAIRAGDTATGAAKLGEADALAQAPAEKYCASSVRRELGAAAKDNTVLRTAVEGQLASGAAPAEELPKLNYYAGVLAYQANDLPRAIAALTEARRLGNTEANTGLMLAEADFKTKNAAAGLEVLKATIDAENAAGRKAPVDWYKRGASVAYGAKLKGDVVKWTRWQLQAYPTPDNWRSALVIYRDEGNLDEPATLDVYRLMRRAHALAGERDYYEYAELASSRGLLGESKAVIDEGNAANVFAKSGARIKELNASATGKGGADKASLPTSEKQALAAKDGKIALNTADAYLGYGDNAKAAELYKLALQKGGIDANVANTRLGIALSGAGQKDAAKAAFAAVTGPRADLAAFWTLYLDQGAV